MKLAFIDVETTGVDSKECAIIELACYVELPGGVARWDDRNLFHTHLIAHPGSKFEDRAVEMFAEKARLGNLSQARSILEGAGESDTARDRPEFALGRFQGFLSSFVNKHNRQDKLFFVGYNSGFDDEFMRRWFDRGGDKYYGSWFHWPPLDVAQMVMLKLGDEWASLTSRKLGDVAARLGISVDRESLHGAKYDIELTRQIFHKIRGEAT